MYTTKLCVQRKILKKKKINKPELLRLDELDPKIINTILFNYCLFFYRSLFEISR